MAGDEFTDGDGLVSVAALPFRSDTLRLDEIEEQQVLAGRLGKLAGDSARAMSESWQKLGEHYESPQAYQLLGAIGVVLSKGQHEETVFGQAEKCMGDYLTEVGPQKQRLATLEAEIAEFRVRAAAEGKPWWEVALEAVNLDSPVPRALAQENEDLIIRARNITTKIREEEELLVRKLGNLHDGARSPAYSPSYQHGATGGGSGDWFVPDRKFFEDASPREVLDWWNGLAPWQREAMRHAVANLGLGSGTVTDLLVDGMSAAADGGGREDIDALSVLVDLFGQDDAVMAGVFEKAGGATVLNAIHNTARSGYENNDDAGHLAATIALVTGLRAGLGRVSTTWDSQGAAGEAKARKFASELLGAVDHERHTSTVGFLFGDTDRARMGERFTVALADEMDRWERDGVMTPWHDSDPGMSYLTGRMADADTIRRYADDPMALVLNTLSEYPGAALDWLTSIGEDGVTGTELGQARVEYYYGGPGTTLPTPGARFGVVADLWSAAQHADGSLLDGGADVAVQQQIANLSTSIFGQLADNETLLPELLTPDGTEKLAEAMMQQLPQFAVNGVTGEPDRALASDPDGPGGMLARLPGTDEEVYVVNAYRRELAKALGTVLARPEGLAVAERASADFEESVQAQVGSVRWDRAEEDVKLAFAVDGAMEGARIAALRDAAARDDERTRFWIDQSGNLVAAGTKRLVRAAPEFVVDFTIGQVADRIGNELAKASAEVRTGELDRADVLQRRVTDKATDSYLIIEREYGTKDITPQEFVGRRKSEFGDIYERWISEHDKRVVARETNGDQNT
jgi:hypothetical protein